VLGDPAEELVSVEELDPVVQAVKLAPVAREVARPVAGRGPLAELVGMRGDADHVEAGAPREVDQLRKRQLTVAPGRVSVQLAQ
jgi:hypothetical protein